MHWFLEKIKINIKSLTKLSNPNEIFKLTKNHNNNYLDIFSSIIEYGGIIYIGDKLNNYKDLNINSGFILKSSGTTGKLKTVLYSFDTFLEKFRNVRFNPIKTVMIMDIDHIGGMDIFFSVISRGGKVIFPEKITPDCISEIIEQEKIEFISASPTFLNLLLLSESYLKYDLSSLKTINFGSEVMPVNLLSRLQLKFPNVKFNQTFGTTETGTMFIKKHPNNPLLIKIPDSKVIDNKLYIKSNYGMIKYLDEESPIIDGYFPSGDIVETYGEYIKILGRESDTVNIGGEKINLLLIEEILLSNPSIKDVKVYSEVNLILGNILVADIVTNETKNKIKEYLKFHTNKQNIPQKINIVEKISFSERLKKIR